MRTLTIGEIDEVGGASEWGDNVLKYSGAFGTVGAFAGIKGAAIGILAGAVVGTIITIVD